jgi:hypothetical protein
VNLNENIDQSKFSITDLNEQIIDYHYLKDRLNIYEIDEKSVALERSDLHLENGYLWLVKQLPLNFIDSSKLSESDSLRSKLRLKKPISNIFRFSEEKLDIIKDTIESISQTRVYDVGDKPDKKYLAVVKSQLVTESEVIYLKEKQFMKEEVKITVDEPGRINLDEFKSGFVYLEVEHTLPNKIKTFKTEIDSSENDIGYQSMPVPFIKGVTDKIGIIETDPKMMGIGKLGVLTDPNLTAATFRKIIQSGCKCLIFGFEPKFDIDKRYFDIVTIAFIPGYNTDSKYFRNLLINKQGEIAFLDSSTNELRIIQRNKDYSFKSAVELELNSYRFSDYHLKKGDLVMSIRNDSQYNIGKFLYEFGDGRVQVKGIHEQQNDLEFTEMREDLILVK